MIIAALLSAANATCDLAKAITDDGNGIGHMHISKHKPSLCGSGAHLPSRGLWEGDRGSTRNHLQNRYHPFNSHGLCSRNCCSETLPL